MSIHIQLSRRLLKNLEDWLCEANVPIVSATQTTRSGYGSSDVELTDTSESFGLPATADLMFALISTEDLEGLGQIMVKQLKNRYNDPTMSINDLWSALIVPRCVCMIVSNLHRMTFLTVVKMKSIIMKKQNQRNHLRDSSSHERLLFSISIPRGEKIADCGIERDAVNLIGMRNRRWDGHYFTVQSSCLVTSLMFPTNNFLPKIS